MKDLLNFILIIIFMLVAIAAWVISAVVGCIEDTLGLDLFLTLACMIYGFWLLSKK